MTDTPVPYARRAGLPGTRFVRWQHVLASKRRAPLAPLHPSNVPLIHRIRQGELMDSKTATVTAIKPAASGELTAEAMGDLRERIRIISQDDAGYTQTRIAREADVSSATLSQFLGGTYNGNEQKIAQRIAAWLEGYDEKTASGGLPEAPAWVQTPTSDRIMNGLRYAQLAADVVVIVGGAGLGKTKTIERYQASAPNVWHCEMTPATGAVLACLEEIAIAVGLRDYSRSASYLQRAILGRIRNTNGVLIIDEAQHLTIQALDQVRSLNDQGKVGLVLAGNDRVYTQLTGGNRAAYLDRLYSRVGKKIHLKKATQGDADAIIKAWGINDAPCRDRVRDIAARPGALRVLNKVLRLAATYAKAHGRQICCDDIQASARELGVFE